MKKILFFLIITLISCTKEGTNEQITERTNSMTVYASKNGDRVIILYNIRLMNPCTIIEDKDGNIKAVTQ